MPILQIEMTEAELYALDLIAKDKQEWADNALTNRARVAVEDLKPKNSWSKAIKAAIDAGADADDDWAVLLAGRDAGCFKTAAEQAAIDEAAQEAPPTAYPKDEDGNKAPSENPKDWPLNRFQFEGMLLSMNVTFGDIEAAINATAMTPTDKSFAISRLRNSTEYNRGHPLVATLMPMLNLDDATVDAAWMTAKDMK